MATIVPKVNALKPVIPNESLEVDNKNNKGIWGIGFNTLAFNNHLGAGSKVFYEVPLSKDLSLSTGLGYELVRKNFSKPKNSNNSITAGGNTYQDDESLLLDTDVTLSNYEESNARADSFFLAIPNQFRLHYLNLPLSLNLHLNQKWRIGLGINHSILLNAPSSYTDGGVLANRTNFDSTSSQAVAPNAADSRIDNVQITPYDIAPTVSLGYYFSPKWGIHIDYQHGLFNTLKYSEHKNYNRFLRFSLHYRFTK